MDTKSIIRQALVDANISPAEMARRMDVTPQAVNGWLRTGRISKRHMWGLAKETGHPVEHFMGVREERAVYHVEPASAVRYPWPLWSWEEAGLKPATEVAAAATASDAAGPAAAAVAGVPPESTTDAAPAKAPAAGVISFETPTAKEGFALRVKGDSMVRADGTGFPDGCYIAVDPQRAPKPGDFVVVRFQHTEEATFKQYTVDGPLKLLKSFNPAWPTLQLLPDANVCGVVSEMALNRKF
ncbi:MAG: hypothetical protein JNM52_09515 [Betaproteobacteria bacterium]|nr:hypothetical protein [Betaproteobacteria bacterium]